MAKFIPIESNKLHLDGGSMFGNAPKALWQKWIKPDQNNLIPLSSRALLMQTDEGKHILFEVGTGAYLEPKLKERYGIHESEHMLLKNLNRNGIAEEDIDAVILSHLHFDHAGGLLSEYGPHPLRLLFPNAKYYVGKEHWERAMSPHIREKTSFIPYLHQLLLESKRLVLIDNETHPDLPDVSFYKSCGHTIGMMLAKIKSGDNMIFYAADLIPGTAWMHLPITMGYDRFPEQLVNEKKAILNDLSQKNALIFFTHDPEVACVRLTSSGFEPEFL